MAARKNKTTLSDTWRERIKTGVIMERLESCANGTVEMTSAQLTAAKLLLSKIVPDLARVENTGKDGKDLIPSNITIEYVKRNETPAS